MTYPFAEVVHDGSSWMVFVGGKALDGNPFKGISWKSKVEIINSAHEARVKEAVREAVEEFKNRVVGVVIKNVTQSIDDRRVPAKVGHDIYEKILALPTEREGQ